MVLNWGWEEIGFHGNVGRLWMRVVHQCFVLKLGGNYRVLCRFYWKQRELKNVSQIFSGFSLKKKGLRCVIFGDEGYK